MKKHLFFYAVAVTAALLLCCSRLRRSQLDNARLAANQHALHEQLQSQTSRLNAREASIEVLRLRCREFEELRKEDAATIRRLGIRIRELQSSSRQVLATRIDLQAPLLDTIRIERQESPSVSDSLQYFRWDDPWVKIEGLLQRDSSLCRIESIDTLHQIARRIPHRFLFFRWGTKAIRQEIRSSNPHTRLIYSDFLIIER